MVQLAHRGCLGSLPHHWRGKPRSREQLPGAGAIAGPSGNWPPRRPRTPRGEKRGGDRGWWTSIGGSVDGGGARFGMHFEVLDARSAQLKGTARRAGDSHDPCKERHGCGRRAKLCAPPETSASRTAPHCWLDDASGCCYGHCTAGRCLCQHIAKCPQPHMQRSQLVTTPNMQHTSGSVQRDVCANAMDSCLHCAHPCTHTADMCQEPCTHHARCTHPSDWGAPHWRCCSVGDLEPAAGDAQK
jgi:hypothetical protein